MSELLIDIGNSRIKWARRTRGGLGSQKALPLEDFATFERVLKAARPFGAVHAVCVAGLKVERKLRAALKRHGHPAPRIQRSSESAAGVTNGYRDHWRLGADRWVGAIGAWHLAGQHRAVFAVDAGTALTIDVVDAYGRHRGGLIAPGPSLMLRSLLTRTHGIRTRTVGSRRGAAQLLRPLADNTLDAIELGSLTASAALIDRCVSELKGSLGMRPVIYLTGGAAAQLAPLLRSRVIDCPDLVLRGLAVLA